MSNAAAFLEENRTEIINLETILTSHIAIAPEGGGDGEMEKCNALEAWLREKGFEPVMELDNQMSVKKKELDDVKKQFDIYKAKMESLLISQLELLKDVNKDD